MTKPQIKQINTATSEVSFREMNDAEYAQHLIDVAAWEIQQAEAAVTD